MQESTRPAFRVVRPIVDVPSPASFKLGGMPYLLEELDCPCCKQCGHPMAFIAQIPLKSPLMMSKTFDMAYVFMCCERPQMRICDSYDPYFGANAVVFQRGALGFLGCQQAERFPEYFFELEEFAEPIVDTTDPSFENVPDEDASDAAAKSHGILFGLYQDDFPTGSERVGRQTKLGGVPCWVQNNDAVPCPTCNDEMELIAQIGSEVIWPEQNYHHVRKAIRFLMTEQGQEIRKSGKHVRVFVDDTGYRLQLVEPNEEQLSGAITVVGDSNSVAPERTECVFPFGSGGVAYVFKCRQDCSASSGVFMWQTT
jgi:hypothetical protein